jgi:RHS repeat-associated protein
MVAINEILLPECTGDGCGGETDICTDSRVHHRSAENRAPATRNRRSAPLLGRWLTRDPIGYEGGINLYGFVDSSPVGNVDAEGLKRAFFKVPLVEESFPYAFVPHVITWEGVDFRYGCKKKPFISHATIIGKSEDDFSVGFFVRDVTLHTHAEIVGLRRIRGPGSKVTYTLKIVVTGWYSITEGVNIPGIIGQVSTTNVPAGRVVAPEKLVLKCCNG